MSDSLPTFSVTFLTASTFVSDGGAMFGLVPKPIWSKMVVPDHHNAIPQRGNSLLLRCSDGRLGLVETGCGNPAWFPKKERKHHGLPESWQLMDALAQADVSPAAIDFILLTHAHWDHAGGLFDPVSNKSVFPNATIYLHQHEYADAVGGDPLLYKSYPMTIRNALAELNDQINQVTDEQPAPFPGVHFERSGGHTRGHCSIHLNQVRLPGCDAHFDEVVFTGDVCPSRHHLRLVFQSAYDTYPLDTRGWKASTLQGCAESAIPVLFSHDPDIFGATLILDDRNSPIVNQTWPPAECQRA